MKEKWENSMFTIFQTTKKAVATAASDQSPKMFSRRERRGEGRGKCSHGGPWSSFWGIFKKHSPNQAPGAPFWDGTKHRGAEGFPLHVGKKETRSEGPLSGDKVTCRNPSEAPGGFSEEEEGETPAAALSRTSSMSHCSFHLVKEGSGTLE